MNTTLKFRWRNGRQKDYYFAICAAVKAGYRSRQALLAALPQFSSQRLVLALEALIAAKMAWIEVNTLVISEDMAIVQALASAEALNLPLDSSSIKNNPALLHEILAHMGLHNPADALALLSYDIKEAGAC